LLVAQRGFSGAAGGEARRTSGERSGGRGPRGCRVGTGRAPFTDASVATVLPSARLSPTRVRPRAGLLDRTRAVDADDRVVLAQRNKARERSRTEIREIPGTDTARPVRKRNPAARAALLPAFPRPPPTHS